VSVELDGRSIERILVLGFGVTGRAVAESCFARDLLVSVSDAGRLSDEARGWLDARGIPFEEGGHTERFLPTADALVLSPGVPVDHPIVCEARRRGLLDFSELDLAFALAGEIPIVAVTGTNGKGTTVTLIDALLRGIGRTPCVGGNIGTPFVSLLARIRDCDVVVLEVSSFQAEQSRLLRPQVGVLLNLAPDHLDRHGSMAAYAAAKGRLFRLQTERDATILPFALRDAFPQGRGRRIYFDAPPPLLPDGAAGLRPHNRANLAAAVTAVAVLDPRLEPDSVPLAALSEAFNLPHRMQAIGSIDGVRAVDDSKSTNADAAVAALRATDAPTVLLIGGRHKGAGYEALVAEIGRQDVRAIVLFGEAAADLGPLFASTPATVLLTGSLDEAVEAGLASARAGDVLLFSPACASFDAYRSYAERGDAFAKAVRGRPGFELRLAKDPRA